MALALCCYLYCKYIIRQQVPTVSVDTLYSPELSSVTAEPGETLAEMSGGSVSLSLHRSKGGHKMYQLAQHQYSLLWFLGLVKKSCDFERIVRMV
jgi:hypothetical protein